VRLHGVVTVSAAHAVAASWPMLAGAQQREPAITAVRRRLCTPDDLRAAVAALPRLSGRRALLDLCDLLEAGCESALEIWGYLGVFRIPGLDHGVRQKTVRVNGRRYRLDLAYEVERVAVELDGDRHHSSRADRERDRIRDAALAAIGWVTLRFSHRRLHDDVAGCRRDTLAALAARRR
jgi:very-short-patch-repair endonuclease